MQAADSSLYTGITTDVVRRVALHNRSKGAKALMGKLPVELVYKEQFDSGTEARKREAEIKSWSRKNKLELVKKDSGA